MGHLWTFGLRQVKLHAHGYFQKLQSYCSREAARELMRDDARWTIEEDTVFEQALAAHGESEREGKKSSVCGGSLPFPSYPSMWNALGSSS